MMNEVGYCAGIENYSRYLSGREAGEPPPCLFDYLPKNALLVIDESHQTIPQLGAMYKGDRSRKETLVEYGFRLPSALDNRPLRFEEFEQMAPQAIYVSATPSALREARVRAGDRAGGASHRVDGPGGGDQTGPGAGGRSAVGDPAARAGERARAGHHPDQADGGGSHRVLERA